jgi:hypothetical protein
MDVCKCGKRKMSLPPNHECIPSTIADIEVIINSLQNSAPSEDFRSNDRNAWILHNKMVQAINHLQIGIGFVERRINEGGE